MNSSSTIRSAISSIPSSVLKIAALLSVVGFVIWAMPPKNRAFSYRYAEDKVWNHPTLVAEYDFPIYKADSIYERQLKEALQNYTPCFRLKGNNPTVFVIAATDMEMLKEKEYTRIRYVNQRHYSHELTVDKLHTPKTAYETTGREFTPNLILDTLTSQKLYDNILQSVSPTEGAVSQGEQIVAYGEVVDKDTYLKLRSLERTYTDKNISKRRQLVATVATAILVSLLVCCFALYLIIFRRQLWKQKRAVLFFSLLTALMTAGSVLIIRYFPSTPNIMYIIPYVWVPILVRVFFDSRTAFILHITNVFIISLFAPEPFLFLLLQMPAGIVAVVALKDLTRRAQLALAAIYVMLSYAFTFTLYYLMLTGTLANVSWHPYVCFAMNAVLVIGVYSLIYIFEKMFRLLSSITLIELSNLNSDLMHTFADKAPGTFQHSLQVSSLASDAAKSIGAKALLVRTGALYHDIGKMAHPEWFVENQSEGHNPLLEMTNREAARAVISHITEGERLAHKHRLPEIIIHFIRSHHGNSLVRYFYNSEVNRIRKENPEKEKDINTADYQYPGPRPVSKEEAILMMADAVEARARSLTEYTEDSIRQMVEQMVGQQIQDGQFALTPLTFNDVEQIKQSFCERLLSIHHHRIQYPVIQDK